jgi:hypothetical protein
MELVSSISTGELKERWGKMRKWKKPTYEQMMEYLHIYSELELRGAL